MKKNHRILIEKSTSVKKTFHNIRTASLYLRLFVLYSIVLSGFFSFVSLRAQEEGTTLSYILTSRDGLSSEEIKRVYQDQQGFMWFATAEGLIRYDGYEFKTFTTSNSLNKGLITNNFLDITQDDSQYLWCATDHGLAKLDLITEEFSFFNPINNTWGENTYNLINSITFDNQHNLWIGTAGSGVYKYLQSQDSLVQYSRNSSHIEMNSEWITSVYCDSKDNIWCCSWEGNLILINEKNEIYKAWSNLNGDIDFTKTSPFCITEGKNNTYWLGLWGKGVLRFELADKKEITKTKLINKNPDNTIVYDIELDQNKNIWLGTPNGIVLLDNPYSDNPQMKSVKNIKGDIKEIPEYEVYSIYCDQTGLIWCGTITGISIWDPITKLFTPYTLPIENTNLYTQTVTAFSFDKDGQLLISARGVGFGIYDLKNHHFIPYTESSTYNFLPTNLNAINCFFWDSKGYLWLGTRYHGLIKTDVDKKEYIILNQNNYNFEAEQVSSIIEDHSNHIWVGTEKGVYKIIPHQPIDLKNFSLVNYRYQNDNNSISSDQVSSIILDSHNQIWIATLDQGINLLTSSIGTHYPAIFKHYGYHQKGNDYLPSNQIMTLFEDANKTVWAGTASGDLLKKTSDQDHFHTINEGIDLSSSVINSICEDANQNLWISTNHGLIKYMKSLPHPKSITFAQANGLQSNQFIRHAAFTTNDGKLFFGGNKGFNYFDPSEVRSNPYVPKPVITKIQVGNKSYPVDFINSNITLSHHENSISITLSALSYSDSQNNHYSTQLIGVDNEQRNTDAKSRTVTYANLKPGTYTLSYNASNNNGVWNSTPQTFTIKVVPALYETWYAIAFYFITLITGVVYYIRKERHNQKLKQALEIQYIEHEKSEKLLTFKKQLFANISNELTTPLNILHVFIQNWKHKKQIPDPNDLNLAQRNINRLIRYTKQLLYYSSAETNTISLSIDKYDLKDLVENITNNFKMLLIKKDILLSYDFQINNPTAYFDYEKIDIVLYNLIAFAIQHSSYKGTITLLVSTEKENNISYATFSLTYSTSNNAHKIVEKDLNINNEEYELSEDFGIGMAITKQMIELHKGNLWPEEHSENKIQTLFRIPISKESYDTPNQAATTAKMDFLKNTLTIEEEIITSLRNLNQNKDERSTILIIEPDADLRGVLVNQLNPYFNMKEAGNGQSGLKYITDHSVDLVISNNATSNISGIDICKEIKKQKQGEYLPFIILSGRPSEEERALSYKAGADSYLPIPIDINTLLLRVQNLMEQKNQTSSESNPIIKSTTSKNQVHNKFLNEVNKVVNKHLSDPNFTVKQLAEELSVSNSMLYRKLMKAVELNPNAFIKKMRLLNATKLLEESDYAVSEIGYKCGFTDISYFSYSFKQQYGISPTAYRRSINK
nr:two-component regulator propeller domain-containing protein [uncultured Carboxylicivirga sp.]